MKNNSIDRTLLRQKIEAAIAKTEDKIAGNRKSTKPIPPENSIGRVSRMDGIVSRTN